MYLTQRSTDVNICCVALTSNHKEHILQGDTLLISCLCRAEILISRWLWGKVRLSCQAPFSRVTPPPSFYTSTYTKTYFCIVKAGMCLHIFGVSASTSYDYMFTNTMSLMSRDMANHIFEAMHLDVQRIQCLLQY